MMHHVRDRVTKLVNGVLLTAVLLFTLAPLFGINLAAYSPTHQHIYLGQADLDHDHHGDAHHHDLDTATLPKWELFQIFDQSIIFLTDKSVTTLALFYIALIWLNGALLIAAKQVNPQNWSPDLHRVQLIYTIPPLKPPRCERL